MKIAVIETGGKQYVVGKSSILTVEKLPIAKGDTISFDRVLLTDDGKETKIGSPYVSGAKVSAELVAEGRGKKITVLRYRPKSRWKKVKGHRQPYTKIRITGLPE